MDAAYFWQKAGTCLRLAQMLSAANPGRLTLLEMAEVFERRARGSRREFVFANADEIGTIFPPLVTSVSRLRRKARGTEDRGR
jgi:hypothetical protein